MKKSTSLILKEFPHFDDKIKIYLNNEDKIENLIKNMSDVERTFFELICFFEKPNYFFNLGNLYKYLSDEWLLLALHSISVFFKKDTFLLKNKTHSVICNDLVNQTQFADILKKNGFYYTQNKIAVYKKRGKIPKEDFLISGVPYWNRITVFQYLNTLKNKKY